MNKRRLLKLAAMLEADAKKKTGISFNLSTVVQTDEPVSRKVKLNCGTQACAMGLAAISGVFVYCGLSYRLNPDFCGAAAIVTTVNGKSLDYDLAAMATFDLTERQAGFLFTPSDYPDGMSLRGHDAELYVAKRIRNFVKTGSIRSARAMEARAADS